VRFNYPRGRIIEIRLKKDRYHLAVIRKNSVLRFNPLNGIHCPSFIYNENKIAFYYCVQFYFFKIRSKICTISTVTLYLSFFIFEWLCAQSISIYCNMSIKFTVELSTFHFVRKLILVFEHQILNTYNDTKLQYHVSSLLLLYNWKYRQHWGMKGRIYARILYCFEAREFPYGSLNKGKLHSQCKVHASVSASRRSLSIEFVSVPSIFTHAKNASKIFVVMSFILTDNVDDIVFIFCKKKFVI